MVISGDLFSYRYHHHRAERCCRIELTDPALVLGGPGNARAWRTSFETPAENAKIGDWLADEVTRTAIRFKIPWSTGTIQRIFA